MKVLLVDDTRTLLSLIQVYLMGWSIDFIEAKDGTEGLKQAREHRPDLVISDVRMPGMDGFELTAALRSDLFLHRTPRHPAHLPQRRGQPPQGTSGGRHRLPHQARLGRGAAAAGGHHPQASEQEVIAVSTEHHDAVAFSTVRERLVQAEDVLAGNDTPEERERILQERARGRGARARGDAGRRHAGARLHRSAASGMRSTWGPSSRSWTRAGSRRCPPTPAWVLGAVAGARARRAGARSAGAAGARGRGHERPRQGGGAGARGRAVRAGGRGRWRAASISQRDKLDRGQRRALRLDRARPAGGPGPRPASARRGAQRQLIMERELLNQNLAHLLRRGARAPRRPSAAG